MGYAAKLGGSSSKSELKIVTISTTNSAVARNFNVSSSLPDVYTTLTLNNFVISNGYITTTRGGTDAKNTNILSSYNASTGILYCNRASAFTGQENWQAYFYYTIKAYYIE